MADHATVRGLRDPIEGMAGRAPAQINLGRGGIRSPAPARLGSPPTWAAAPAGTPRRCPTSRWPWTQPGRCCIWWATTPPDALRCQADLAALPLATGSLAAGWASRSYVHLDRRHVPLALADLHRALAPAIPNPDDADHNPPAAPVELHLFEGDADFEPFPDDDFPGRRFSLWPQDWIAPLMEGAGFALDDVARLDRPPKAATLNRDRPPGPHPTRHRGAEYASADLRPEPQRVRGRRRCGVRPARQSVLARGAGRRAGDHRPGPPPGPH